MFIYIVSGAIFALLSVMSLFLFLTVRSLPTFVALLLTLSYVGKSNAIK